MAEEKEQKLGPNVTYQPDDDRKEPTTVHGVQFVPGKAVNLEERLGKTGSQTVLEKLSKNRFFKVDGGTDWKQEADQKAQAEERERQEADEIRKEMEESKTPQPPPDWKGPEKAELESDSGARRPTVPRGRER